MMILSRLYANKSAVFEVIDFNSTFNAVVAEIRLPENREKDTHNLGKTTLGRLIDFCLLAQWRRGLFLHKHRGCFEGFVFFLEVGLLDGGFLTIRRGIDEPSRINFKLHSSPRQNLVNLSEPEWDHSGQPFERAQDLLDALLDLRAFKPWLYRKGLGYCLRSQDDFGDVFQLARFAAHSDWKPFVAHLLGFNSQAIGDYYKKEVALEMKQKAEGELRAELGGAVHDLGKIDGLLLLKHNEAEKRQRAIDAFDFRADDKEKIDRLVNEVDAKTAALNKERYHLAHAKKRILEGLKSDQVVFDPQGIEQLFAEVGVLFPDQLKVDYEQLISFNRAITEERRTYLTEELSEVEADLKAVAAELNVLNKRRAESLIFLTEADVFEKYKKLSGEVVSLRADIVELERRHHHLQRLHELRREARALADDKEQLLAVVEEDVKTQNEDSEGTFARIRVYFSEIIQEVISRQALLSVSMNTRGHLEFGAEILDEMGNPTGAATGHTYKKLLCVAFDMALARAHRQERYPRFLFHDGVFESLDDRKKMNLLQVIKRYTAAYGLQHVITLIDSDMPPNNTESDVPVFDEEEIIVRLHDEGENGRLFKMPSW